MYGIFSELKAYFNCVLMILCIFICFLLSLLYHKFCIAKNFVLFGVNLFCLNLDGEKKITFCMSALRVGQFLILADKGGRGCLQIPIFG